MFEAFASPPATPPLIPKRTIIDARLHHWTVSLLQVTDYDDHISQIFRAKSYAHSQPRPLCIMNLSLEGGACHVAFGGGTLSLAASFHTAAVHFRVAKARSSRNGLIITLGHLEAGPSSIAISSGGAGISVDTSIGPLSFQMPGWSPPLILRATRDFATPFLPSAKRLGALSQTALRRKQLFFAELAQKSCAFATHADPLSRTQVSFMVNSGIPRALRADSALSILAHMRFTLRQSDRSEFTDSVGIIAGDELSDDTVRARLTAAIVEMFALGLVDLNPEHLDESFVYKRLYPDADATSTFDSLPPLAVDFRVQSTTLSLGDDFSTPNLLELGQLRLRANISSRSFIRSNPTGNKSSTSLLSIEPEQPTRHIVISSTISMVRLVVNPTLFTVVRGILRLTREFTTQQSDQVATPSTAGPSKHSKNSPVYVIEASFAIEELEHRAVAQLLSLGIRLKEFSVTSSMMFGISSPRAGVPTSSSQTVTARFREFALEARSIREDKDQGDSERALLASMMLVAAECFVVRSSEEVKGTFALAALKFSVPRSAMKLYSFSKQWEAEYLP